MGKIYSQNVYIFFHYTNERSCNEKKEGASICEKHIQFELLFKRDGLFDKLSDHQLKIYTKRSRVFVMLSEHLKLIRYYIDEQIKVQIPLKGDNYLYLIYNNLLFFYFQYHF